MEQVQSIDQLRALIGEVRAKRQGFVTNFYLDEFKHGVWIAKGDCFAEKIGDTLFVIRKDQAFWNVFYNSTSLDRLRNDLNLFIKDNSDCSMMFDVIGRDVQCQPVVAMMEEMGCKEVVSFVRMIRLMASIDYTSDASICCATLDDVPEVSKLLHYYFDARVEQIPYDTELMDFTRQGHVLLCKEQGILLGFLIYELNNTTLYLRYWFTHPDFRDKKVGSRLLKRFFEEGRDTKRQLLWVIRTNENAIKRYRHYGFDDENMFDHIMTNK